MIFIQIVFKMNIKLLISASIILLASSFAVIVSVDWKVKDNNSVKFKFGRLTFGKDSMVAPNGTFKALKASISFDEVNPEKSKITASIDARTIDTGNSSKDGSAKGPDVLVTDKFPLITFESTTITKVNNGYEATGKLTIKDITKEIKFPFVFEKETFSGGFTIETKDFNFTHPHVPKEISIFFTIPVTK
jgi:polyisoprenoid-binding protein YceI